MIPHRPLREIALTEFALRLKLHQDGVRARHITEARAVAAMNPWAAMARFFGADLPARFCDADGAQKLWIDFYPDTLPADHAMQAMAHACREAAIKALTAHEARLDDIALQDRTRGLLRLDASLSVRAGIGPIPLPPKPTAGPETGSRDAA